MLNYTKLGESILRDLVYSHNSLRILGKGAPTPIGDLPTLTRDLTAPQQNLLR